MELGLFKGVKLDLVALYIFGAFEVDALFYSLLVPMNDFFLYWLGIVIVGLVENCLPIVSLRVVVDTQVISLLSHGPVANLVYGT